MSGAPVGPGAIFPLLALETSTRRGSAALMASAGAEPVQLELSADSAHARDLLPAVAALVQRAGLAPSQVAAIAVGLGPGSYTGLRVGVCAARALASALGARLLGLPSLEVLAFDLWRAGERGLVAIDARAGEFYAASYERMADGVRVLQPPQVLGLSQLALAVERGRAGEERLECDRATAQALGLWDAAAPERLDPVPSAAGLGRLAAQRLACDLDGGDDAGGIEPLYLREFGKPQPRLLAN